MNNQEKEPTNEPTPGVVNNEAPETEETPEAEKGETFKNYGDFYSAYINIHGGPSPVVRIHGKSIEKGRLIDDVSGFVDVRPHKMTEYYSNMNVYDGRELIACFRLDQKNIHQFRIEIIR